MPQPLPTSSLERRLLCCVFVIFALAIALPYFLAWRATPPGDVWGGLLWKTYDPNVHLAWARQARDGMWFTRDLFTTEDLVAGTRGWFFNALTALMGFSAWILHVPVIVTFHLVRVLGALWALWQVWLLVRTSAAGCPLERRIRTVALGLVAFATGAGWLAVLVPQLGFLNFVDLPNPPRFTTMPECFFITSAFAYPLNIVSYGLLALIMRNLMVSAHTKAREAPHLLWGLFLPALLLANIHTYDAVPLALVLLVLFVWQRRARPEGFEGAKSRMKGALAAVAVGLVPPVLYQFVVLHESSDFRVKALVPTFPPPFWVFLATFAPLLALAAYALWRWRRPWGVVPVLLTSWLGVTLLGPYLPLAFGRKMVEGIHLPLCLLASVGLCTLTARLATAARPNSRLLPCGAALAVVLLMALSPLHFVGSCLADARENDAARANAMMPPCYLAEPEWDTLKWLNALPAEGRASTAVFCLPFLGAYGPHQTGMTFYIGHWDETLHLTDKLKLAGRFYSGAMSSAEATQFLRANHIGYVILSQYERRVWHIGALPAKYPLRPVWNEHLGAPNGVLLFATPWAAS